MIIYKATNLLNGKVYIGQTIQTLKDRMGEIFNSIIEAAEKYNIAPTHISRVCRGKRNRSGGFHWEYVS